MSTKERAVLVVAEKPSVAQSIAKVIGAYQKQDGYLEGCGYIVSWCLGHLAEYAEPEAYDRRYSKWSFGDLPIIPERWKLEVAKDKAAQFRILKKLMTDFSVPVECVVNACDAGREGEAIFMRVYELAGCRLPVKRLWISSMEDSAILEGFRNLKDGSEYRDLYQASVCRAQADWLVGMNATRAYTKTYDYRLTVGRVQTPTLAMLVQRKQEIETFQKKQYFVAHILSEGLDAVSEHMNDRGRAEEIAAVCKGEIAEVKKVQKEQKTVAPPKLYDLTTLQREANRLFGFTAKQTLDYAQSLYEKKYLTYPRTDSQYLTDDMESTARGMIDILRNLLPFVPNDSFNPDVSKLLNSKRVSDHHAIIPTAEIANADMTGLPDGEKKILFLSANRLICAAAAKHSYISTKAELFCGGQRFTATGKTIFDEGWKRYEDALKRYLRAEEEQEDSEKQKPLPELSEGQIIPAVDTKVTEHWTKPPAPYTEDSLLAAMERAGNFEMDDEVERKGLGTPATRAGIIEKLVSGGYAIRKKKQIIATDAGMTLISVMPEYLTSAQMTADWENKLLLMEQGKVAPHEFMEGIYALINTVLEGCRKLPETERRRFSETKVRKKNDDIGICPVCGNPAREGKKNFYCTNRDCSFSLWKENRYLSSMRKNIDKKMAADLLSKGRTHVKDLYSAKTGKNFAADLVMEVSADGKTSFHLDFPPRTSGKKK